MIGYKKAHLRHNLFTPGTILVMPWCREELKPSQSFCQKNDSFEEQLNEVTTYRSSSLAKEGLGRIWRGFHLLSKMSPSMGRALTDINFFLRVSSYQLFSLLLKVACTIKLEGLLCTLIWERSCFLVCPKTVIVQPVKAAQHSQGSALSARCTVLVTHQAWIGKKVWF